MSSRQSFEALGRTVPYAETFVVTSLPRGGLQIVQPSKVPETLLRSYGKDFHIEDRPTWEVIKRHRPLTGADCMPAGEWEESRYYRDFMQPAGLRYLAVVPLAAPVFEGYAGAWHVYRTLEQGDFTASELHQLAKLAEQFDEGADKSRHSRRSRSSADAPWVHRVPVKQFVFDGRLTSQLRDADFKGLDERLQNQVLSHARTRLAHVNGDVMTSDRLTLPDSRGDLWVFRFVLYTKYPALGHGPFIFLCLQPDCKDWGAIRPADFQADPEISRLVPALQYMQDEFHRGPTLNDIARMVHLSPFHFHRRFTELFGITPKHFLLECQIYSAKTHLAAGDKDLVDIASGCGFAHQSHFTSRFKQATGLTPTRWRKLATQGQHPSNG